MIKGSIHQEGIKNINVYAPNKTAPNYMKQTPTELREEINNSTIIFEDFNTPLSILDRTARQKINKNVHDLNNTINQPNRQL